MSSNYGFEPTLDGLNSIDADSSTTNNIICDTIQINVSGTVPTRTLGDNTTNIANTQFVQNAVSTAGSSFVSLAGNQTLTTGIKTFINLPECSAIPTTGNQLVNKSYADSGAFVNLTTAQTINGIKSFNNNLKVGAGINNITGTNLTLNTVGGEDIVINGSNDITFNSSFNTVFNAGAYGSFQAGSGYTFVNNGGAGLIFNDNASSGNGIQLTSGANNIVNRSINQDNRNNATIWQNNGGANIRGAIYDNSLYLTQSLTFTNGQATDIGTSFSALLVSVPPNNVCNMIRVSIPFDLLAWSTFGLPAGSGTIGLRFDSFSVVYLKNSVGFTPSISQTNSPTGTTLNWNKTGTQTNISGMGAYFGNLDIAFNISINNTTTDSYQVRITPQATITNYSINFDNFKFVCRNPTGGQTNGNGFTQTSITSFTGGTLVFSGGNPTFVDTSITQLAQSYPIPFNSCYLPLNNNITPSGMITQYAGSLAPQGWLLCDGGSYSITTYPNLYAVIGNTYGGSLGAGTFNTPDTRGIFISGSGSQVISGNTYTRTLGAKQAHQLQDHKHTYSDLLWYDTDTGGGQGQTIFVSGADYQVPGGDNNGSNGDGNFSNRLTKATYPSNAVNPGTPIQQWNSPTNVSALTGTETYPANIAFNYIIKW